MTIKEILNEGVEIISPLHLSQLEDSDIEIVVDNDKFIVISSPKLYGDYIVVLRHHYENEKDFYKNFKDIDSLRTFFETGIDDSRLVEYLANYRLAEIEVEENLYG